MLASRDLFIAKGDVPKFWQWISYPNSRFPEAAEFRAVLGFEIRGKINSGILSSGTKYAAYLVFTPKSRTKGFQYRLAEAWIIIGQETNQQIVCIDPDEEQRQRCQTVPSFTFFMQPISLVIRRVDNMTTKSNRKYPKLRGDGWMEVELGEFFVMEKQDRDVKMILKEFKGRFWNWKCRLIIQVIEIRPRAT
ncbi:F-box protein At2g02240-like [Olea europaea var. sylvestris]|nr:F-box protein At2g02240-like [Olea europaea var. sylvestris]